MALSISDVYFAQESTFATDPDSDGSDYLPLNADGLVIPVEDTQLQETNYQTGRGDPTGALVMASSGALQIEWPLTGLSTGASDGVSPPTKDVQDLIFEAAFGAPAVIAGEGLASSGTTTSVILDTDLAGLTFEDLMCINFASHSEWRPVTVDAGTATYTIAPALSASPDAARDAFGSRIWVPVKGLTSGHLAAHGIIGSQGHTLLGGRPTSLKLSAQAGKIAKLTAALRFNSVVLESKGSLPAISTFSNPGIKQTLSEVIWGTTAYPLKSVEIDFGLKTIEVLSTAGSQGRSGFMVVAAHPRITIEPAFASGFVDDFKAATKRELIIQIGSGELASSRVSTCCFHAQSAQVKKVDTSDDGGYLRQKVVLDVVDAGIRTGTTAYRLWTFARA